jgi:His/Glu/Gln/Arg/opine family amino acid ABC transporter permease subunit
VYVGQVPLLIVSTPQVVRPYLQQHPSGIGDVALRVSDLDQTLDQVTAAGGTVVQLTQTDLWGRGRWAQIQGWGSLRHTLVESWQQAVWVPEIASRGGALTTAPRVMSLKPPAASPSLAIDAIDAIGAFPSTAPNLWEVSFLPNSARNPALTLMVLAAVLGVLTFASWQTRQHPLAIFAELYIDMIRGIPMLVIILYVGFPLQGAIRDITAGIIDMSRVTRGIVGISLGYAAYMAEIFRAGIEAIPKGQFEAARSLGLNGWQTAFYVVLPQALKIVIPPLGNEFIAMLKDTSLLSILSVRDITQRAREFQSSNFIVFAPFNTVAILYISLTLASSSLVKFIERRGKHSS